MTADLNDAGGRKQPDPDPEKVAVGEIIAMPPDMELVVDMMKMYSVMQVDRVKAENNLINVRRKSAFANAAIGVMRNSVGDDDDALLSMFIATICSKAFAEIKMDVVMELVEESSQSNKAKATLEGMIAMAKTFNHAFTLDISLTPTGWVVRDPNEEGS